MTTQQAGGAVATQTDNPFARAANAMSSGSGGMPFLNFNGKTGQFTAGRDKTKIPHGSRFAINANESKLGWICWIEGSVEDEVMVPIVQGTPPLKESLEDHSDEDGDYEDGDGWKEQASIPMRDLETGEEFLFKTSAKSGISQLGDLMRDYGAEYLLRPDEVAVVELDAEEFEMTIKSKNSKGKEISETHTNFKPIFDLVDWLDEDEQARLMDLDAEAEATNEDDLPDNDDNDLRDDDDDDAKETTTKDRGTGRISDKKNGRTRGRR